MKTIIFCPEAKKFVLAEVENYLCIHNETEQEDNLAIEAFLSGFKANITIKQ